MSIETHGLDDLGRRLRGAVESLNTSADDLNASLRTCEDALRARGFTAAASVPMVVQSERSFGPRLIPGGQLGWLEADAGTWGLVHLHPDLGCRSLFVAELRFRVGAARVLEELLYQLVLAEDALVAEESSGGCSP